MGGYDKSVNAQFFAKNNSMSARNEFKLQFWVINTLKKKFKAKKCNHVIAISGYV